ncbi:MAG: endopeptidase La [Oligoflexia bacterium]|nr:endopeptidase La [Oligoflexia bacterium]
MAAKKKTQKRGLKKKGAQERSNGRAGRVLGEAEISLPATLPVLPARDLVAFPSVMMSLYVGRPSSVKAVENANDSDKLILILAQRDVETEEPQPKDLFKIGVVAHIVRSLQVPDGRLKVLMQGIVRARINKLEREGNYYVASIEPLPASDKIKITAEDEVIVNRIRENLQVLVQYEHLPEEMLLVTEEVQEPGMLSDVILAHYKLDHFQAQNALEELDPLKRLRLTDKIITDDLNQFLVSERIKDKTQHEMAKGQREYYLREQIKQIQRELGENEASPDDLGQLKQALNTADLPEYALAEAKKQLTRLERMSMESSEYALLRTYLEWILDLPWSKRTKDRIELKLAQRILDEDHYGLEKVKDRILEYLSVRKLNPDSKGPILCFVGPPGVGKTSLGKSIARALNRKFYRMSLGGMRDEAEIRGHRRTYVGALPGRILQGMKQAGSINPVFVLDELDKVGADFRGDPASALLEVLDPQQNKEFTDHYLNMSYDLSEVMFVATSNTIDTIPEALLDRLEVIYISGYTTEEKVKIAERFLIPRQMTENGIQKKDAVVVTDKALLLLIERYTREAGVRNLEREIGSLCRKLAREQAEKGKLTKKITEEAVLRLLGPTKYDPETTESGDAIGLVRGLAWTAVGGEVMPVEASVAKGSGTLNLTGQLGSVMQESAQAALFFARSNAEMLGLDTGFHQKLDIHIHVPGGATPKDGPSAGITIVTALVSALSKRKVSRDYALTGEVTLRGNVLPIGGLKEKALAALRYGINKVIIPYENIKDLEEIPKEQRDKIKFIPVKHVSEVLKMVLIGDAPKKQIKRSAKRRIKPIRANV